MSTIGKKIRRTRIERGLTLSQLAKLIHVSSVTIHNIEYDIYEPRISTLLNLCRELDISIDYLIDSEPNWLFKRIRETDPQSVNSTSASNGWEVPDIQRISMVEGERRVIRSSGGELFSVHVVFGRIEACTGSREQHLVCQDSLHLKLYDDLSIEALEPTLLVTFSRFKTTK